MMRGFRKVGMVVVLAISTLVFVSVNRPAGPVVISGMAMGARYHVKLADAGPPVDEIERVIRMLLEEIEGEASQWRESSWVSRFNAGDSLEAFPAPEHVWAMLQVAQQVYQESGGRMDVTVGPLVELWGFGYRPESVAPKEAELARTLSRCGFEKLVIDDPLRTVRRTVPGVQIDLSALAKGYAVDRIDALLRARDMRNFLIDFGGELRARGTRSSTGDSGEGAGAWRIRIPGHGGQRQIIAAEDCAYATSGGSEQNRLVDGAIVTHLIDPRSGRPVAAVTGAVTVQAERCVLADAWATALSVASQSEARQLARTAHLELRDWRN